MIAYLLNHLLERSATRFPDRIAVRDQGRSLTYRQLDELATCFAVMLHRRGMVRGDRVGIDLEKSVEAVVAIFAVLKVGAVYVPIDPKAPANRIAVLISDCRMRGFISTNERLGRLDAALIHVPECLVLLGPGPRADATMWPELDGLAGEAMPDPGAIEQDLAYILYTSGSTGEPKGVMLSHRAALSFVNWAVDYFRLEPDDQLANHAPLHFDLSVFDLFAGIAVGGTVALVPPAVGVFPRNLADWIEREGITVWYSVPSALVHLSLHGALDRHTFPRLRLVLFAGEVFPVAHLRRFLGQVPGAKLFNLYGPTETNVCTVHPVTNGPSLDTTSVPIGRACANCEVFALDEQGRPLAPGGTGELYVRGPTLMEGYWGRPEQTRAVLGPHPLFPERPGRVYRTGDLVRLDETGDYYFVGRRDAQVKSRGYRIELGDIESVLHRHPDVVEAVVVAVPHDEFGCTLRGLVVAREGSSLDGRDLATLCGRHLPAYMIPAEFVFRAALPKTSSGKVDRIAVRLVT
jgi:amino acid adenylation domain-containing protein